MAAHIVISIHIPLSASVVFQQQLQQIYQQHFLLDENLFPQAKYYQWRILRRRWAGFYRQIGDDIYCIHGNAYPFTYQSIAREKLWLSWVKDPVDRVVAHYQQWQQAPNLKHDLCRKMVEQKLSLLEFARLDKIRNLQQRYIPENLLKEFFFIGITEEYEQSLKKYQQVFGLKKELPLGKKPYCDEAADLDAKTRGLIIDLNKEDMKLYETARSWFGGA